MIGLLACSTSRPTAGSAPEPESSGDEPTAAPSVCEDYLTPRVMGTLPAEIGEASGLAVSGGESPVLWLHNDSGDSARIYAVDPDSGLLGTIVLAEVVALDWEDMSRGPCAPGDVDDGCLYVGDIGDNYSLRPWIVVYRLPIPDALSGEVETSDFERMSLTYPDGSRDAEALVVDAQANVFVLTKDRDNRGAFWLYSAPFEPGGSRVELTTHGVVDIGALEGGDDDLVTAADLDSTRNRLLVRTYDAAIEYRLPTGGGLADLSTVPLLPVPFTDEPQGESIAYGRDGYWHVSEGHQSPIYFVGCRR